MGISLAVSHSSLHQVQHNVQWAKPMQRIWTIQPHDGPDHLGFSNQVQHNVLWGQADNLMMIPTDCDQRDERLGPRNQRDATEVE